MLIRKAKITDVESFWNMQYELDKETKYMLYEPEERSKNLLRVETMILRSIEGDNLLLFAEDNDNIVGYISAQRGTVNRIKHSAYIVIGIRKKYQHKGIGTRFFEELDRWAIESGLKRLELTVLCPNVAAKKLYEKSGFVIEGVKKCSIYLEGEYVDEYYMAKLL